MFFTWIFHIHIHISYLNNILEEFYANKVPYLALVMPQSQFQPRKGLWKYRNHLLLLKYILVSNKIKFDIDKKMILNGHDIKLKWRKPGVFVNMLRPNSQYIGKGAWQQIYPWPLFCFWPLTLTYTFLLGYEIHDHQKSLPLFQ